MGRADRRPIRSWIIGVEQMQCNAVGWREKMLLDKKSECPNVSRNRAFASPGSLPQRRFRRLSAYSATLGIAIAPAARTGIAD